MTFTSRPNRIKTLKQSDKDFMIHDGLMITPRAGFEVSNDCPREYRFILLECLDEGWIKPVANVLNYEYTMDKLKEPQ